jgi:thiopurine S-methyltransferase
MLWLEEQGYSVVGIELSRLAIEAFFHENALTPEVHEEGRYSRYVHGNIELVCADFLSLSAEDIGKIDAFFDRAALIALTPAQRSGYAAQLAQLLPGDTPGLLITLDYQQHEMSGPPFAVSHDEVCQLFESCCTIEHLLQFNALEENARFSERGVTALTEHAYRLRRL